MEEKRPGQQPEAETTAEAAPNQSAREGGKAKGGLEATEQDRKLVREADARGERTAQALRDGGFGDHKGVDGFPEVPRTD